MGRGHQPHVQCDELAPPSRRNFVLLEDPEQIHLGLGGHLAHFVEKERAPLGHLEPARLAPGCAAEGSFLVAEQLALDQAFGECPDVGGDERPVAAPAQVVDGAGHQLLARAAFPLDQDGQIGIGDLPDALEHLADGGALADHFRELAGGGQPLAEQPVLLEQAVVLESLAHLVPEHLEVNRFGQIIVGTEPHRFDGRLDRAVGGDHQDQRLGPPVPDVPHQV